MYLSFTLNNLKKTNYLGKLISQNLTKGAIILISGEMGVGKTTLIKSICSFLGVNSDLVISPTYKIINRYQGHFEISHVDFFRLELENEIFDFDNEEIICENGITLIEWPKFFINILKNHSLVNIKIKYSNRENRSFEISSNSNKYSKLFDDIKEKIIK